MEIRKTWEGKEGIHVSHPKFGVDGFQAPDVEPEAWAEKVKENITNFKYFSRNKIK